MSAKKNSEEFKNCPVHWQKKMEVKTIIYTFTMSQIISEVQSL